MLRPTLTPEIEEEMVKAILADPDRHVVMPRSAYRADGSILVHRDNLSGVRAQRWLFRRMVGRLERNDYLRATCKVTGCLNPHHYQLVHRTSMATHCPNGHRYTKANTLPDGRARCRTCKEAADIRRRERETRKGTPTPAELNAQKTQCIRGHAFTPENTYLSYYHGRQRRACRTCVLAQSIAYRKNQHEEKQAS